MAISIRNDFHNTQVDVRPSTVNGRRYLSSGQVARARRALCGIDGCTCGGAAGQRGRQVGGFQLEEQEDGGAEVVYP